MKRRNIFWGSVFIAWTVFLILNQLHVIANVNMIQLTVTALLLPVIVTSIKHLQFGGILFPLAVIGILFAKQLGIEQLSPWPLLGAALLLSIGLSLIFPSKQWKEIHGSHPQDWDDDACDGREVHVFLRFGGSSKYLNSHHLERVHINCQFSGTKVFFDHAELEGTEAAIDIEAKFSGIELYIPRNWIVKNEVSCVLGGVEEKGVRSSDVGEKTLILRGKISFSGISIIYI